MRLFKQQSMISYFDRAALNNRQTIMLGHHKKTHPSYTKHQIHFLVKLHLLRRLLQVGLLLKLQGFCKNGWQRSLKTSFGFPNPYGVPVTAQSGLRTSLLQVFMYSLQVSSTFSLITSLNTVRYINLSQTWVSQCYFMELDEQRHEITAEHCNKWRLQPNHCVQKCSQ